MAGVLNDGDGAGWAKTRTVPIKQANSKKEGNFWHLAGSAARMG